MAPSRQRLGLFLVLGLLCSYFYTPVASLGLDSEDHVAVGDIVKHHLSHAAENDHAIRSLMEDDGPVNEVVYEEVSTAKIIQAISVRDATVEMQRGEIIFQADEFGEGPAESPVGIPDGAVTIGFIMDFSLPLTWEEFFRDYLSSFIINYVNALKKNTGALLVEVDVAQAGRRRLSALEVDDGKTITVRLGRRLLQSASASADTSATYENAAAAAAVQDAIASGDTSFVGNIEACKRNPDGTTSCVTTVATGVRCTSNCGGGGDSGGGGSSAAGAAAGAAVGGAAVVIGAAVGMYIYNKKRKGAAVAPENNVGATSVQEPKAVF